jgi:hypothetical protein
MPDILRQKAATEDMEPTVWEADLRSIGADRTYALAMVPYNSFCNLQGIDDQLAALEALHDVLDSGGRLLFNVYVPRYDTIAESFGEWQEVREVEYEGTQLRGRSRASIANQVKQIYHAEQELVDSNGDVLTRDEFVLSHLPPQQVELLARLSPFERWSVSGGFDGEPLTDRDSVQVWELVK